MKDDLTLAIWRKSTYSSTQGQCVEVAALGTGVAVRDSKNLAGAVLSFPATAWSAFTSGVCADQFG